MNKLLFSGLIMVCLWTPLCGKKIELASAKSLHTHDWIGAAVEICQSAEKDIEQVLVSHKEDRKKKKRRFFKKLLSKVATVIGNLALKAFSGKNDRSVVIDACESIRDGYEQIEWEFIHWESKQASFPCLHCLFESSKESDRREILNKVLADKKQSRILLESLFFELSDFLSYGIESFNNRTYRQFLLSAKFGESRFIEDDSYLFIRKLATNVSGDVSGDISGVRSRSVWSSAKSLLNLIATLGDLNKGTTRLSLVDCTVVLMKNMKEMFLSDGMFDQFEKLSVFVSLLRKAESEDWKKLGEDVVGAAESGLVLVDDMFTSIGLCMKEKLQVALEELFEGLVEIYA